MRLTTITGPKKIENMDDGDNNDDDCMITVVKEVGIPTVDVITGDIHRILRLHFSRPNDLSH